MAGRFELLEEIVRRSPAVCFLWRAAEGWPVEFVTDNVEQFGYSAEDLTSGRVPYASIVHPDDLERVAAEVAEHSVAGDAEFVQVYRIRTRSGEVRWLDDRTWVRRDEAGAITHYQGIVLDITERRRAEEEVERYRDHLESIVAQRTQQLVDASAQLSEEVADRRKAQAELSRVNRLLTVLSTCNQALIRSDDEEDLMASACRILAEVGGFRFAGILCRPQPTAPLSLIAHAGWDAGTSGATSALLGAEGGPADTALRTGAPQIIPETLPSAGEPSWRDEALRSGFRALVALPLSGGTIPDGVLLIGSAEPQAFPAAEMSLLLELAADVSYCLSSVRSRAQQRQMEDTLRESEEKYRIVLRYSHDGVFLMQEGIVVFCNEAFAALIGATADDIQGQPIAGLIAPEDRDEVLERYRRRIMGADVPESYEFNALHRDGETRVLVHMNVGLGTYLGRRASIGTVRDVTQERRHEVALRASREQLREVADNVPGVIYQFYARADSSMGLYLVTDRSREVFGIDSDPADFFARFTERVVPEDRQRFLASIDEVVRSARPWCFEGRFEKPGGEIIWFRGASRPVAHGDELVFSGVLEDITERVKVQQALSESERKHRTVIENIQDVFYRSDADGRLVMVSPSILALMGYDSLDECLGKSIADGFYADPVAREDLFRALREKGAVTNYEITLRRRDGKLVVVSTNSQLRFDEQGRFAGVEGIFRDVTELKRAEAAVRESEQRLQRFLRGSPVPCFVIGPDHTVALWNDALAELTGIAADAMIGTRDQWRAFYSTPRPCLADILLSGDLSEVERWYSGQASRSSLIEGAFVSTCFFPELGKGGRWLQLTAATVRDGTGTVIGAIETLEDITERRLAEEELRQAQKLESVGRLAAGVAHDFNNMLTPIIGYAEMLAGELSPVDKRREKAERILRAAERSHNLTRQLLAFSRKQVLSLDVVDLRDVVAGMESLLRQTLREDIELGVRLAPEPCTVRADVGQLEQVLMNLTVNAQDAMPHGGSVTVSVALGCAGTGPGATYDKVAPRTCVELTVTDTGTGMDEATREHAFEPFFTTKEPGVGTGLGLATVYGIVKQHDGTILLETSPGAGSTFRIFLPECSGQPSREDAGSASAGSRAQHGETVMVVEDSAAVLDFVVSALEGLGFEVLHASRGRECLELMAEHDGPIHLLLTDVIMPDMNGMELSAKVQRLYPHTKTLFMSGYPQDVTAQQGVLEGRVHLLRKPFSLEALAAKVRAVLDEADESSSTDH